MGAVEGLTVVNFSHPLTEPQRDQIAVLAGQPVTRVIDVPTHLDEGQPFTPQIAALVETAGLSAEEWQTLPLLVSLPSSAPIVAGLLAYLHGGRGHFLAVPRLRPVRGSVPSTFEIAEIVDLYGGREHARGQR